MPGTILPPSAGSERTAFTENSLRTLKQLIAEGHVGNRWYMVNLHAHGHGNDPRRVVEECDWAKSTC